MRAPHLQDSTPSYLGTQSYLVLGMCGMFPFSKVRTKSRPGFVGISGVSFWDVIAES